MTIPYLAWPIIAGITAVTMETIFRKNAEVGWQLWFMVPAVVINYLYFKTFQGASSLMVGAIIVALSLIITRSIYSQFALHEAVTKGNLVAALVLAAGAAIAYLWR